MAICKVCSKNIVNDKVECDGVCGLSFHSTCLKRSSRSSSGPFTCGECSDIKPCHVLRLVRSVFETLSSDQNFIAEKVNGISANCAGLQLFSDDLISFSARLDRLLEATTSLNANNCTLLSKLHEVSSKIVHVSEAVDDLRSTLDSADSNSPSVSSGPILPAIEDIRRSVKQLKNDFGAWAASASGKSEETASVVSDIKGMLATNCVTRPHKSTSTKTVSSRRRKRGSLRTITAPGDTAEPPNNGPSNPAEVRSPAVVSNADQPLSTGTSYVDVFAGDVSGSVVHSEPSEPVSGIGTVDVVALRPAVLPRCVFVSRIHPDTTESDVVCHVSSRCGIPRDVINCRRIDKSRNDAGSYSASFKIVIPEASFTDVVSRDLWPSGSIVREFVPRNRSDSKKAPPKNVSARYPSTTLM